MDKNDLFKIVALIMLAVGLFILNHHLGQANKSPRYRLIIPNGSPAISYVIDTEESKIYTRVLFNEDPISKWSEFDLPVKSKTTSNDWLIVSGDKGTNTDNKEANNNEVDQD